MDQKTADKLRKEYPVRVPLEVASQYLGVAPRTLSKLIADGREPFCRVGANISMRQKYIRVYTERLIAYLNGELPGT